MNNSNEHNSINQLMNQLSELPDDVKEFAIKNIKVSMELEETVDSDYSKESHFGFGFAYVMLLNEFKNRDIKDDN